MSKHLEAPDWRDIVRSFEADTLNMVEFCKQRNLKIQRFLHWYELFMTPGRESPKVRLKAKQLSETESSSQMLPVEVQSLKYQESVSAEHAGSVRICLPHGISIVMEGLPSASWCKEISDAFRREI